MKQRNGVLGLETSKQVFTAFLILAVTAVAIILSLTALNNSVGNTIDNRLDSHAVTNESDATGNIAFANTTGYTLSGYNSTWGSIVAVAVWGDGNQSNGSQVGIERVPTGYTELLPSANYSLSSAGVLTNATTFEYPNVSVSYTYANTVDTRKTDNIVGNVSGGLETFFASTGTIFSILIVIVIILAISVIIWAVGRFGQKTESTVAL